MLLYCCIFRVFLENFQELLDGLLIAVRRRIHFYVFWVLEEEPSGATFPAAKRCMDFIQLWVSLHEGSSGVWLNRQATRVCDLICVVRVF